MNIVVLACLAVALSAHQSQGECRGNSQNSDMYSVCADIGGVEFFNFCDTCDRYLWCSFGTGYNRPCPPFTYWDNGIKTCTTTRATCADQSGSNCGSLPPVENGLFEDQGDDTALLQCDLGYAVRTDVQGLTIACTDDQWEDVDTDGFCEYSCVGNVDMDLTTLDCPDIGTYRYQLCDSCTKFVLCNHGYAYIQQCTPGLFFDGLDPLFCKTTSSTCSHQSGSDCGTLPPVENGFFEDQGDNTALLQCNLGYAVRTDVQGFTIACTDGQWFNANTDGFCEYSCVGNVNMDLTTLDCPDIGTYRYQLCDSCTEFVLCNHGYALIQQCTPGLFFDGQDPNYYQSGSDCGTLPPVGNGFFEDQGDNTALLKCNLGYAVRTDVQGFTIACTDGQWFNANTDGFCEYSCVGNVNMDLTTLDCPDIGTYRYQLCDSCTEFVLCNHGYALIQQCTLGLFFDGQDPNYCKATSSTCSRKTARGKEFVVAFFNNFNGKGILTVTIISTEDTTLTVSDTELSIFNNKEIELTANVPYTLSGIPEDFQLTASKTKSKKVLFIEAKHEVTVYAFTRGIGSSDGALVFPVHVLGNEYIASAGPEKFAIAVVALEDGTDITITFPSGLTEVKSLNRGEMYYTQPNIGPPAGTRITSQYKPIAVFTGNECTKLPVSKAACDTLYEQLLPVTSLGSMYIAACFLPREVYRLEIVAINDNTAVTIGDGSTDPESATIQARKSITKDYFECKAVYVSSSKPVMVTQFAMGGYVDNRLDPVTNRVVGDPSMVYLPAVTNFDNRYFMTSFGDNSLYETACIIVKSDDRDGLRINGNPLPPTAYKTSINVPSVGRYDVLYVDKTAENGADRLSHVDEQPFGAVQYGAAPFKEYTLSLGINVGIEDEN